MDRRRFISTLGHGVLLAACPGLSFARADTDSRLVLVILRGGLDGLAAVPPYADPGYAPARGSLVLPAPGSSASVLDLDGFFGLHPSLPKLHQRYRNGELAVLHAVATPYRERSHFDAQDVLENGMTAAGARRDGWLNRALAQLSPASSDAGIALGTTVPLSLRGPAPVTSWAPSRLPDPDDDTLERIAMMYANDALLAERLQEAREAGRIAEAGGMDVHGARRGGPGALNTLAQAAGRFLAAPDGPRVAVLEAGGWDTHANQGAATGALARRLAGLDAGLDQLALSLADAWQHSVVIVVTEFGRTVAVNGTGGTDHGTAAAAFLLGGAVAGKRVLADWPGLSKKDRYQGRDLRPTTDLRAIFKGVLQDHFGLSRRVLDRDVFPDSAAVQPAGGLLRS
ncbi:MAG TPA: DUF1501 domain-containing protein [Chromatiales bacterium]|nr:DUF1501 domain-containing protein [Chromatiales bacterium]